MNAFRSIHVQRINAPQRCGWITPPRRRLRCTCCFAAQVVFLLGCSEPSLPPVPDSGESPAAIAQTKAERAIASPSDLADHDMTNPADIESGLATYGLSPLTDEQIASLSVGDVMQAVHESKAYREWLKPPIDPDLGQLVVRMYRHLASQVPPKGDPLDFQTRAGELADAADAVLQQGDEAVPRFRRAVNCNSCHARHR
ncbi:hypothetical protein [Crateriforma conspicua]|uniref:Uncharacterized protein n=1 Tax=Crateriforma conspicua TaxID=2527996 RepID=A0A5C5Y013_9PLAN|nr:hypothetical protein [Crateriforma conspicua]QDV62900.1 hypothetical protein Mal65_20370 [Crateriforma conspicua]TWT68328.1 hypothetical protein Pan14r_05720 [Crateriforma conspicua]